MKSAWILKTGDFIAILGHNGSRKSTLAKHINALFGADFRNDVGGRSRYGAGRRSVEGPSEGRDGFQNPDNQIIGTVVEEDVGFSLENIGVPTEDIWKRVDDSLGKVGMLGFRDKSPNKLPEARKQRVAIAGVVAMHPECIVLDEPTAMLDPNGRKEILSVVGN